jgi:hypothetical protein
MLRRILKIRSMQHYAIVEVDFKDTSTMVDVLQAESAICTTLDAYTWLELRQIPDEIDKAIESKLSVPVRILASKVSDRLENE